MPFAPLTNYGGGQAVGGRDGTMDFVRMLRLMNQKTDPLSGYDDAVSTLASMFGTSAATGAGAGAAAGGAGTEAAMGAATDSFD